MTSDELRETASEISDLSLGHVQQQLWKAADTIERLENFAATLWEHSRDQAQQTSECDEPEYAAWGAELIEAAKALGIDAAVDAAINSAAEERT